MRHGADDSELEEIIGAAVALLSNFYLVFTITSNFVLLYTFNLTFPNIYSAYQIKRKKAAHAGMFNLAKTPNRPMIHIGG